jgi:hypothetical protein
LGTGDLIGRFFASWVIIYFWQLYEKTYTVNPNVCATYFQGKICVHIELGKNGLGYILGDF